MAITNYSELQTAAANWLNRANLTDRIPEFIALGEAYINREIRTRAMETSAAGTFSNDQIIISSQMTRFRKIKSFVVNSGGAHYILNYISPQQWSQRGGSGATGLPREYTINGDYIFVIPYPDSTYSWDIYYTQSISSIVDGTNWVITNHPDLYMAATLAEAYGYIKNKEDMVFWAGKRDQIIASINMEYVRDVPSGTTMQTTEMGVI